MHQQKKLALFVVCFLLVVFFLIYLSQTLIVKNIAKKITAPVDIKQEQTVSPNILYLTQPIYNISGIVDKIEGNTLTLSYDTSIIQARQLVTNTAPTPTEKLIYKVVFTDKTSIVSSLTTNLTLPMAAPNASSDTITPPKLTLKDIRTGEPISIVSNKDLRTLSKAEFEAVEINLLSRTANLSGKIITVKDNVITVKGRPFHPPSFPSSTSTQSANEKIYQIIVSADTDIYSQTGLVGLTNQSKIALSNLKKDAEVNIYTDADVSSISSAKALKIEIMVSSIAAPSVPSKPASSLSTTP